jgi:hypothetical protein
VRIKNICKKVPNVPQEANWLLVKTTALTGKPTDMQRAQDSSVDEYVSYQILRPPLSTYLMTVTTSEAHSLSDVEKVASRWPP